MILLGIMMLQELLHAADRGVKVRLLIDDQNGTKLDPTPTSPFSIIPTFQLNFLIPINSEIYVSLIMHFA